MSAEKEPLNSDYEFYRSHKKEFLQKYQGKYLLIYNKELIADYKTQVEAMENALKKYEVGTFLIQQCVSDDEEMMKFYSRVSFSSYASS